MNRLDLIGAFVLQATGQSLEAFKPTPFSGWQVIQALWPLNERFRPNIAQIRTIAYSPEFDSEANRAVEALVLHGDDWKAISPGAWRVLLERQQQLLLVASMLEAQGRSMTQVPAGLSADDQSVVAIADLLHSTKLPQPAADRAGFELPAGSLAESSLQKH